MNEGDELFVEYAVQPPLLHARTVVGVSAVRPSDVAVVSPDNDMYIEELGPQNRDIRAWYRRVGGGPPPPAAAGIPTYDFAAPLTLGDFALLRPAAVRLVAEHDAALAAAGVAAVVPVGAGAAAGAAAVGFPAPPVGGAAGGAAGLAAVLAGAPAPAAPGAAPGPAAFGGAAAGGVGPLAAALGPGPAAAGAAALAGHGGLHAALAAGLPPAPAAVGDDFRTLAVSYDQEGKRHKEFRDAVKAMRQQPWPDWVVPGPCTVLWCAAFMLENGGSAVGHHIAFRSACRLGLDDPAMLLHSELSKIFQTALCYDQVDASNLASMELICRQLQLCEEKLKDRILGTVGSGHQEHDESWYFTGLQNTRGVMVCPALSKWVSEQVASENSVLKERRKAREERALAKPPPRKGGRGGGDGG